MLWGGDEGCGTHRCCMDPPMERPMKRNDLSRSLVAFDQASTMVAVVELSFRSWLVAGLVPGLTRQPLKRSRCASVIDATAPLAGRSHQGRQHNQPDCRRIRGWPRRLLACALVAGARDRGLCDPPDQYPGVARTSASKDGSTGYRIADAGGSRAPLRAPSLSMWEPAFCTTCRRT